MLSQTVGAPLRSTMATLPESGILRVFRHGLGRPGLIPLWAGEGDLPTPGFIVEAAARSMRDGETFYTNNRGILPLREALAAYTSRLYGRPVETEEIVVTGGGMQAIQLAMQATVEPGCEVIVPSPAWPNFEGAIRIQGGVPVSVPMTLGPEGWQLAIERLAAAVGPKTRAIVVNSPSNPTGWTASQQDLARILALARQHKLWIIADEIYARFHFAGGLAPSFQEIRQPDDPVIFVNTFSKNWAMTGWRIGWVQVPRTLTPLFESLVQYNTSGVPTFLQRGAVAAIEDGEAFVAEQVRRARAGRDIVARGLANLNGARHVPPAGAFYSFFTLPDATDTMTAAMRLIDEAGVGIAPGAAFGDGSDGCFRICFLRSSGQLEEAMQRLAEWARRG